MKSCDWTDIRSGRSFVYMTCHLARAGVYDVDSIESIIENANLCDFSDLYSDRGLANATNFLFCLNNGWHEHRGVNSDFVMKYVQRNRFLLRNSLFQVLELDFIREVYGVETKVALHEDKRNILISHFQNEKTECGAIMGSSKKIVGDSHYMRTRNFLYRDFQTVLRDKTRVSFGYPLPVSSSKTILIKNPNSIHPPDSLLANLVLIVTTRTEIGDDGELFGRCKEELVYLKHLGFETKVVDWRKYSSAVKASRNLSFVRNILK